MPTYDGPTLRAIRESMGVTLRHIARLAGMSHGHLSKVERGEHGRPITPAIVAAYEKATRISLTDAAAAIAEHRDAVTGRRGRSWRAGQLTDLRRLSFNAAIGATAVGGQLGEPVLRLIDSTGRAAIPTPSRLLHAEQIEQIGQTLTSLDLRYGGGMCSQLAKAVLRWVAPILETADLTTANGRRIYSAVSAVTGRAAWAAFDTGAHEPARSLYRLAVYTAVRSGDVNLRGHLVADAAAQHNHLGYHEDALNLIRQVDGDERIQPPVRMVLHHVKARAYAAAAEATLCRRSLQLAAQARAETNPDHQGWLATLHNPAHHAAAAGHALAALHRHTGETSDLDEARQHLTTAANAFNPHTHARAAALCHAQLANLHLHAGDPDNAQQQAQQAINTLTAVDSARLRRALATVRDTATEQGTTPDLVADLNTAITNPGNPPPADTATPADEHQHH